jgi:hypothetical protein
VSFDVLGDLNWLAVIVAAIAYFAIGALWYAPPVFGKTWADAGGFSLPERGQSPNPAIYVTPLIGSVLSAIALGMIAKASGTDTFPEGIVLGLVVAIGFAISIALVTAQFETTKPKPMVWGAINGGYHMVGNLVAAIIVAVWQ